MRGAPLSQSQTFSNMLLSNFSKLSYLGDFIASQPRFLEIKLIVFGLSSEEKKSL
jgi:hypothetical protein